MNVKVNGKDQTFDGDSISVGAMLTLCRVNQPDMVSVQLNGEFVQRENYASTPVKDGDEIDFLYFMGGGGSDNHLGHPDQYRRMEIASLQVETRPHPRCEVPLCLLCFADPRCGGNDNS